MNKELHPDDFPDDESAETHAGGCYEPISRPERPGAIAMPHHSGYPRHPDDFYIEDDWCFDALPAVMGRADFAKGIYDPACGVGTIPIAAVRRGFPVVGSDKVDRPKVAPFRFTTRDFLEERTLNGWPSIVMNSPYKAAREFIDMALREVKPGGIAAALVPLSLLVSQERHDFFQRPEVERSSSCRSVHRCLTATRCLRAVKRGGGQAVYSWVVFRAGGRRGACVTADFWMPPVVKTLQAARRSPRKPAAQLELPQ